MPAPQRERTLVREIHGILKRKSLTCWVTMISSLQLNSFFRKPVQLANDAHECSCTDQKLREVMGRYLEQIHLISQGKSQGSFDSILAPDCKKILNGKLISSNRDAFVKELETINKTLGNWTVVPRKMICSSQDRTLVLSMDIALNQKAYLATVFFHFNRLNLISLLDETFVEANGSYQFDGG